MQRIADLGADAEGEPRRPVPRLADTALADQLAVVVDDVLRTGDPGGRAGPRRRADRPAHRPRSLSSPAATPILTEDQP